ncbi:hypothetical protein BMS3Abin15_00875 [bacterium BMS3Abin15]|nr:hypothetical protein BMS3Abin15_00875 [bacterium BMS3Abin15]HDZ84984.1 hypothetical protein [Candidatus Moranbacteria bacterium]
MKNIEKSWIKIILLIVIGIIAGYLITISISITNDTFSNKNINEKRTEFIEEKNAIIGEQLAHGDYACCLEKPCTYCIEKTPKHGDGAKCSCLEDVVNGVHPCGECIGEIMEGHGNRFLSKFFARSIAEEVGTQYTDTLKKIMEEKYGIPITEQL